jgi:hypothetical protein
MKINRPVELEMISETLEPSVVSVASEGAAKPASLKATHAILQTGRLGDLWFTVPLADDLWRRGHPVEVWYDQVYGNPFAHFPSVLPRPVKLAQLFPPGSRPATIANSAAAQAMLYAQLQRLGRKIVWNQIYPLRIGAWIENKPYPQYWYRRHPGVDFRRARTDLSVKDGGTILYFAASVSLRIGAESAFKQWLESNLETLRKVTNYRVLYVPPPGAPDHQSFETWRGDLDAYQRLIASCGMIFGIITSAHVLGQLLGKPVIACYANRRRLVDTIGNETIKLFPGDILHGRDLVGLLPDQ